MTNKNTFGKYLFS